jgi:ssDNA-binding Zn-finger/Zn-ribbon topoisomerase 1
LEPHPEEAPVVKRIFELYTRGVGSVRICDILDAEHIKPMDGDQWVPSSVREILQNPHYIGKVRWNYRPNENRVESGEIKKHRVTAEDFLLFEGKHPAIVPQELWDAVQIIRGNIPRATKKAGLKSPLAGVLRCSCGKVMVYKQIKNKGKLVGRPRFHCGGQRCKENGSAIAAEVIDEVVRVLQECIDDFEVRIEAGTDNSAEVHKELVERLEKRLASLRTLETKQWDEKIRGKIPDHVFEELNSKTVAEIAEVSQALCDAKDATPVHVDLQEQVATFHSALNALKDPDAPVEEQNKLVRACIERIVYRRPNLGRGKTKDNPPFELDFTLRV